MAFGFVEEQEWKNSSSLLHARCANRKFKTYERRTSSLQTIGQRRQPLSLSLSLSLSIARQKKKATGGKMSPIYKSFFTIWPSVSISLPLLSLSLSLSLSLQGASIHYISKKIFDQLRAAPSKQLIVYPQVRRRRLLPFVSVLN